MSLLTRVRLAVARRAMRFVLQRPPSPTLDRLLAHAFSMAMGDRHPPTLAQVSGNVSWLYAANRQLDGHSPRRAASQRG